MTKLIVSVADGYEYARSDALKSRYFQIVPSKPVLRPMTSVLGSVDSGTHEAASKNLLGTASLMSVNVTVWAFATAAISSRTAITVSVLVLVSVMCAVRPSPFVPGVLPGLLPARSRVAGHHRGSRRLRWSAAR